MTQTYSFGTQTVYRTVRQDGDEWQVAVGYQAIAIRRETPGGWGDVYGHYKLFPTDDAVCVAVTDRIAMGARCDPASSPHWAHIGQIEPIYGSTEWRRCEAMFAQREQEDAMIFGN